MTYTKHSYQAVEDVYRKVTRASFLSALWKQGPEPTLLKFFIATQPTQLEAQHMLTGLYDAVGTHHPQVATNPIPLPKQWSPWVPATVNTCGWLQRYLNEAGKNIGTNKRTDPVITICLPHGSDNKGWQALFRACAQQAALGRDPNTGDSLPWVRQVGMSMSSLGVTGLCGKTYKDFSFTAFSGAGKADLPATPEQVKPRQVHKLPDFTIGL